MNVAFACEKFFDAYRDALALLEMHYREIAPYPDLFMVNCDLEAYQRLEAAGALVTVTARDAGVLVGYFVMICRKHPHYCDVKVAVEDLKFVHPRYRGVTGIKMIKFAEHQARQLGCKVIFQRSKAKSEHGAMYRRLGYDLIDEVYARRLDQEDEHGG